MMHTSFSDIKSSLSYWASSLCATACTNIILSDIFSTLTYFLSHTDAPLYLLGWVSWPVHAMCTFQASVLTSAPTHLQLASIAVCHTPSALLRCLVDPVSSVCYSSGPYQISTARLERTPMMLRCTSLVLIPCTVVINSMHSNICMHATSPSDYLGMHAALSSHAAAVHTSACLAVLIIMVLAAWSIAFLHEMFQTRVVHLILTAHPITKKKSCKLLMCKSLLGPICRH